MLTGAGSEVGARLAALLLCIGQRAMVCCQLFTDKSKSLQCSLLCRSRPLCRVTKPQCFGEQSDLESR